MPKNATIREGVFGLEDGLVSTLGSITGIALATNNPFTTLLSGTIIVSVECISMAVGSYLSSQSERAIEERKISEEKQELQNFPEQETKELIEMYVADGWPQNLAEEMAHTAAKNPDLFFTEMAYRELRVFPHDLESPIRNAAVMGITYIIGGLIPLWPYIFFSIKTSAIISLTSTGLSLFLVGAFTTKFSHRVWWKVGLEMLILGGTAATIGFFVGQLII